MITTDVGRRLPRNRPPTHPGEMLFEEFVKPLGLTQTELARVLGMSADFWLGLQHDWDLWHALNSPEAEEINQLQPITRE
jgi:antitoxin HigA-1